jgi:hypothetical protein
MVELDEKNARSLARVLLALLIYDLVFAQFVFLIYVFNFSCSILYLLDSDPCDARIIWSVRYTI